VSINICICISVSLASRWAATIYYVHTIDGLSPTYLVGLYIPFALIQLWSAPAKIGIHDLNHVITKSALYWSAP